MQDGDPYWITETDSPKRKKIAVDRQPTPVKLPLAIRGLQHSN